MPPVTDSLHPDLRPFCIGWASGTPPTPTPAQVAAQLLQRAQSIHATASRAARDSAIGLRVKERDAARRPQDEVTQRLLEWDRRADAKKQAALAEAHADLDAALAAVQPVALPMAAE